VRISHLDLVARLTTNYVSKFPIVDDSSPMIAYTGNWIDSDRDVGRYQDNTFHATSTGVRFVPQASALVPELKQ
jgi:hypothetical protein